METMVSEMRKCEWQRDGGQTEMESMRDHDTEQQRWERAEPQEGWFFKHRVWWSEVKLKALPKILICVCHRFFHSRAFPTFYLNIFCLLSYHTRYAICSGVQKRCRKGTTNLQENLLMHNPSGQLPWLIEATQFHPGSRYLPPVQGMAPSPL